jgi:hypothetical protein
MRLRVFVGSVVSLAVATALTAPLAAQSRATTDVDTTHVTVGDRVTLTLTVDHPSSTGVIWPDSLDLAPFEVLERATSGPVDAGDESRSTLVLTLTAFELGTLEVPSFDVVVAGADGTEETLSSSPVGIEVASVGVDESGEIRDIRGPLTIPLGAFRLLLWILLPLALAGLLWMVARRLRSRDAATASPALGPLPRPAHVVALEALDALERAGLLERGQVKEFHIEAAEILRAYVSARFGVDAPEMTTYEVVAALAPRADARVVEGLGAFLDQCDLVKFAKVRPGPDASRQVLALGRRVVLDSAPPPQPAAAASGDDARASVTEAA